MVRSTKSYGGGGGTGTAVPNRYLPPTLWISFCSSEYRTPPAQRHATGQTVSRLAEQRPGPGVDRREGANPSAGLPYCVISIRASSLSSNKNTPATQVTLGVRCESVSSCETCRYSAGASVVATGSSVASGSKKKCVSDFRYAVRLVTVVVSFNRTASFAEAPCWMFFPEAKWLVRTSHRLSGLSNMTPGTAAIGFA